MNFKGSGRSRRVEAVIDITSLVDVVFLLIIFLLVTTTFKKKEHAFSLDLPTATEKELIVTVEEDQPTIFITQEGEYFLLQVPASSDAAAAAAASDDALTASQLEERLRTLAETAPDTELSVKAQDDTPYQRFIDVMNLCRKVGIRNVLLPYELVQPGNGAPPAGAPPAGAAPAAGGDSRDKAAPGP